MLVVVEIPWKETDKWLMDEVVVFNKVIKKVKYNSNWSQMQNRATPSSEDKEVLHTEHSLLYSQKKTANWYFPSILLGKSKHPIIKP